MQCERSGFAVDRDYWIKVLEQIINTDTAENALIADARAGYGKSTFINALVLAMIAASREKAEYRRELGGMIVSLQKVEDLNRLVKLVAEVFGDTNDIVAIQGWTESGKAEGFCKNPDVTVFEQCDSKKCPYAFKCPLLSFQIRASTALIVCVTHVRFRMYLDSPTMMNTILIRQDEFMFGVPRRYILFDENPHLDRTAKLSLPLIHKVSNDLNAMCRSNHISERMDRCLQSKLSFSVQGLYQKLRGQEGIYPPDDSLEQVEAVAGRVSIDLSDFSSQQRSHTAMLAFIARCKISMTSHMHELFSATSALYLGTPCVYCRSNGFSIFKIVPPQYLFQDQLTLIFDATAAVDGDYAGIGSKLFLPRPETDDTNRLTMHVHSSPVLDVSRSSLRTSWKMPAFARLIHDILAANPVQTYLVTYMGASKPLYEALQSELPGKLLRLIAMKPNKPGQLPYFGGTNGSNAFNHCTQMIVLGQPRLNPETNFTASCAAYGMDTVIDELEAYQADNGILTESWDLLNLDHVADYACRYTVARLEQEIYRTALRNYKAADPIHVHLFCPREHEFQMLLGRFPSAAVEEISEVPGYFTEAKALSRSYKGGKTHFAKLEELLRGGLSLPLKASEIRAMLGVSSNVWKELMHDDRVHSLLNQYGIERVGRGSGAVWSYQKAA